jgi:c-di-GMP-binding flagellar brake protein YcgR
VIPSIFLQEAHPMSILQDLNHREISQVILSAAQRKLPLTITVRDGQHWANFQSRVLGTKDHFVLLERPLADQGATSVFSTGQSIGVSLKLKHHKYLFLAGVACQPVPSVAEAGEGPLLIVGMPTAMQRLQRRSYIRAAVPAGCVARAAFWVGGHKDEPSGTGPTCPVWSGRVTDLSAGGFSIRTTEDSVKILETGDLVGTRLRFGIGQEVVYADACVRHLDVQEGGTLVGFQFLGLEYSDEGKVALQAISLKVNEFHAAAPPRPAELDDESPEECVAGNISGGNVAASGQ